jgi:hypothetical protein
VDTVRLGKLTLRNVNNFKNRGFENKNSISITDLRTDFLLGEGDRLNFKFDYDVDSERPSTTLNFSDLILIVKTQSPDGFELVTYRISLKY